MKETDFKRLGRYALERRWTSQQIATKQQEILRTTLALSSTLDGVNFTRMAAADLRRMCMLYDDHFFEGRLLWLARREGIDFNLSSRMTRAAGKTVTTYDSRVRDPQVPGGRKRTFEVILSTTLLFQTFHDLDRQVIVSGCVCNNRLQAAQRVCEHELVHLVEMLCFNDSNCAKRQFHGITRRFFGHTDYQHQLITQDERAAKRFQVSVGSPVEFQHEGKVLRGKVNRITRRATVLVPDGKGQMFDDGQRYKRFYVPLERLKPLARAS
ncbi:hypothetical protein CA51_36740 [Rosistilla oblonga]|uniref:hypothetical protein n=1 Tax=Rosistilla oblonga TaxID=2527990 RepID=UPI00118B4285|nr:hypothetical protein [Rosistilla oblonga]QDV13783.1 hypothetical protein CA51_36740 [Rosistilla oblonga]